MDDEPSLNAIHEAGHILIAWFVGIESLMATAKQGEDQHGKWAGRVIYDQAELASLHPHQRRMTAVAGSTAELIAQGLTPTLQSVIDGMSDSDLEYCRACGQWAFELAVDEVANILQNPDVWPHLLEVASRLDDPVGLITGKFQRMLDDLS